MVDSEYSEYNYKPSKISARLVIKNPELQFVPTHPTGNVVATSHLGLI